MLEVREPPADYAIVPMDDRRCSRCGEVKPVDEFPVRNKARGLRRVWCRDCCRAYGREHYERNKPTYLAKNVRRRASERPMVRMRIDEYLREHPCVDCGCAEITVLEFDHRDPSEKRNVVGRIALMGSWPSVLREIEKCDVRCANCHRKRTAAQFVWARATGVVIDTAQVRPGRAGRYAKLDASHQDPLFSPDAHGLRRCSRCGEMKALPDFPFRDIRAGQRAYYCRPCQAAYRRAHYARNKSDYIGRAMNEARLKKQDVLLLLHDYLRAHPCVDCGEADLAVLEFDHLDPDAKTMAIGAMIGRRSWKKIVAEIEKCVVRCANCHRKRTAAQRAWKWRLAEDSAPYGRICVTRVWRSGNAEPSQGSVTSSILVTRSVTTPR